MIIHLFGNSQLNNFSFCDYINFQSSLNPNFIFYYFGPVLAYNFYEHYFQKVKTVLPQINKNCDYIIFVVGEIDCRYYLPLKAEKTNKSEEEVTKECADRFSRVYDELKDYKIIIFSSQPTSMAPADDISTILLHGTLEKRNRICTLWNKYMKEISEKYNFPYLSFYEDIVDEHNLIKPGYFFDHCHLNSKKLKPFIEREFKKIDISI